MSDEFRAICQQIKDEHAAGGLEAFVDSDDLYQSDTFCGGWIADERVFGFSFYAPDGQHYIFTFSAEEALSVADGGTISPTLRLF